MQEGLATERQIIEAIAEQVGVPFADTAGGAVDPSAAALLPRDVAREITALPVAFGPGNELVVAVADPGNTAGSSGSRRSPGCGGPGARRAQRPPPRHRAPGGRHAAGGAQPRRGRSRSAADRAGERTPKLAFEEERVRPQRAAHRAEGARRLRPAPHRGRAAVHPHPR
jgi:hypothetical protein